MYLIFCIMHFILQVMNGRKIHRNQQVIFCKTIESSSYIYIMKQKKIDTKQKVVI